MAGASSGATSQVIWSDKGIHVIAISPTDPKWFTRFMTGLCSRIGEHRKQDTEISIALIILMQHLFELGWYLQVKTNDNEHIITAADNY